ncbi:RNA-binding protein EWS, partial [Lunasporangiospora selenospora]
LEAQAAYDAYYGPGASAAYAATSGTGQNGSAEGGYAAQGTADPHKSGYTDDSGYPGSGYRSAKSDAPPGADSYRSSTSRDYNGGGSSYHGSGDRNGGHDSGRSQYGENRQGSSYGGGSGDRYGSSGTSHGGSSGYQGGNRDEPAVQKSSDTVYVSGLGTTMTEKDLTDKLEELFKTIGRIKIDKRTGTPKIRVYVDFATGAPKGDATVTYEDPFTTDAAIKWFNGTDFHGNVIKVEMSEQKVWAGGFGGPGGGRGRGRGRGGFGGPGGDRGGFGGGRGGGRGGFSGGHGGPTPREAATTTTLPTDKSASDARLQDPRVPAVQPLEEEAATKAVAVQTGVLPVQAMVATITEAIVEDTLELIVAAIVAIVATVMTVATEGIAATVEIVETEEAPTVATKTEAAATEATKTEAATMRSERGGGGGGRGGRGSRDDSSRGSHGSGGQYRDDRRGERRDRPY